MIQNITIVGGTHGNEFIGPYLIRKLENQQAFSDSHIPVDYLLANPEAFKASARFIDTDLNRSFSEAILKTEHSECYEHKRAKEINQLLGPKPCNTRFIVDLHSTTSNMGMTLLVRNGNMFSLRAAAYVQRQMPDIKIIVSDKKRASVVLNSISEFGLGVEVGPIHNGVVRHELFEMTEQVIRALVEFPNFTPEKQASSYPEQITAYQSGEKVIYPQDENGEITAMIHKDFQDKDFTLLKTNDIVFMGLDNKEIQYTGTPGYPIFINEAAYYREGHAFVMTEKKTIDLTVEA